MGILESLLAELRACFETLPDKRRGQNCSLALPDIAMSAFSVFFMGSPSFLDAQR
jgi:hypothetical protein